MALTQLVYHSRNRAVGSKLDLLRSILSISQRNNARDEITGFLIFDQSYFFQILEGERGRVMAAYERIQTDGRHADLTLMSMRDVRERSFPRWSMGGVMRNAEQSEIFLSHGVSRDMDPARLTAPTIVGLAMDLQDVETAREHSLPAVS